MSFSPSSCYPPHPKAQTFSSPLHCQTPSKDVLIRSMNRNCY
jgi:hypothetical protein